MSQNQVGNQIKNYSSMSSTDPIADMLSRIRNAIKVNKAEVMVPHSKVKKAIATLLVNNGFLSDISEEKLGIGKMLRIKVKNDNENAKITEVQRLSKPGRRQYVRAKDIPLVKRGRGMIIVSTSKGIMTDKQAKQENLGGELICEVY